MSKEDILRYMRISSKTNDEQILELVERAIKIVDEIMVIAKETKNVTSSTSFSIL